MNTLCSFGTKDLVREEQSNTFLPDREVPASMQSILMQHAWYGTACGSPGALGCRKW